MSMFVCKSCGHLSFETEPDKCPACATDVFERNDTVFSDAEKKSGEAAVKHIPSVTVNTECGFIPESTCRDVMVRIGEVLHPMEEKHFIRFIDCYLDLVFIGRSYLTPGLNPAACFHIKKEGKTVTIVENCTIHGYWKTEVEFV